MNPEKISKLKNLAEILDAKKNGTESLVLLKKINDLKDELNKLQELLGVIENKSTEKTGEVLNTLNETYSTLESKIADLSKQDLKLSKDTQYAENYFKNELATIKNVIADLKNEKPKVIDRVIEKTEVIREVPFVDAPQIAQNGAKIALEATEKLIKAIPPIEQEIVKNGESVRDSLELLMGENRLSAKAIKDLPKAIEGGIKYYGGTGLIKGLRAGTNITIDNSIIDYPMITSAGGTETDPLSLHLDQTTPQTFTGGTVTGSGLLKVTSGELGLDTKTYIEAGDIDWATNVPLNETDPVFSAWLIATPPLYSESDTLDSVTTRGATTANGIQVGGLTATGNVNFTKGATDDNFVLIAVDGTWFTSMIGFNDGGNVVAKMEYDCADNTFEIGTAASTADMILKTSGHNWMKAWGDESSVDFYFYPFYKFQSLVKLQGQAELGIDADGGSANTAGILKFWSAGDNAFYNTFTAGTNTANATYTLPTAMPASTGFLKSTDAGVMSWDTNTYLTSVTAHNLLSTTHGDTLADTVVRGDLMIGNSTPKWARLAKGTSGYVLKAGADDISWVDPATVFGSASFYIDCSGGTSDTYGALSGLVNSSNTVYTTSQAKYVSGTLKVYLNGQLQTQGSSEDWVETTPSSGTFTFATAPLTGDIIVVAYQSIVSTAGNADLVDGIHAATTGSPTANQLYSLDADGDINTKGTVALANKDADEDWAAVTTNDGGTQRDVITINGDEGSVNFPRQSYVRALMSGTQTIANATYTVLVFDTEGADVLGEYDNSTGIFTAKDAGVYAVTAVVLWQNTDANKQYMSYIYTSVINSPIINKNDATANAWWSQTPNFIISLPAGGTIKVTVYQNSGGNETVYGTGSTWTALQITKVS